MSKVSILGGAGFIGSNLAMFLSQFCEEVLVVDNYSNASPFFKDLLLRYQNIRFEKLSVENLDELVVAQNGFDSVIHLASNADIAAAAKNPLVDFENGTLLTSNALEASRRSGIKRFIYASGSGVYGGTEGPHKEQDASLMPVSTYGASKIAGEALVAAYAARFNMVGRIFRFANVVGPMQTHGVAFDFINKLRNNRKKLDVLGNGTQKKSYVWVDDVNLALKNALFDKSPFALDTFNVSSDDTISVDEISQIVVKQMFPNGDFPQVNFASTNEGWPGDVPYIKLDNSKLKSTGWAPTKNSYEAIFDSVKSMLNNSLT